MAAKVQTYSIPISNGIFAHCQRIGPAIWGFMWLIDHVTREGPGLDGNAEGFVYGGRALRTREIALNLGVATRTVQEHLDRLVAGGYLRRLDPTKGLSSGYAVLKSKKWNRIAVAGVDEPDTKEPTGTARKSAQVRKNPRGVRGKTAQVRGNPLPYIETVHNNTQTISSIDLSVDRNTASKASQKPEDGLRKSAKALGIKKSVDPRFTEFVAVFDSYHKRVAPEEPLVFTARDGKQLKTYLADHPKLTVDEFARYISNRESSSGVNHAEPPAAVLSKLDRYRLGALDKYGNPLAAPQAGRE